MRTNLSRKEQAPKSVSGKQKSKRKKRRVLSVPMLAIIFFVFSGSVFLMGKIMLRSVNSSLSAANHELSANIQSATSAINVLETEISQLQDKSRVLGMLEGQVSENQENIYYYNSN